MDRSLSGHLTTLVLGFNDYRLLMIAANAYSGVLHSKPKTPSSVHVLSGISVLIFIVPKLVMNSIVRIGDGALWPKQSQPS